MLFHVGCSLAVLYCWLYMTLTCNHRTVIIIIGKRCTCQRILQVWAVPTTKMQCEWLGERVATVDVSRAITNVIHNKEDAGWGPNAVFRFPKEGGTGAIWKGVGRLLPASKQVGDMGIVAACSSNQL